jgi:uncharacterized protein DUF3486
MGFPPDVRQELDRRLLERAGNHREIVQWLAARGCKVSLRTLERYAGRLWRRVEAGVPAPLSFLEKIEAIKNSTDRANLLAGESPEQNDPMVRGLIMLVQSKLFDVLTGVTELDLGKLDTLGLTRITRAIGDLARIGTVNRRLADELRAKVAEARKADTAGAPHRGLSPAAADAIRNALLGIPSGQPAPESGDGGAQEKPDREGGDGDT